MSGEPRVEIEGDAEPASLERIHQLIARLWTAEPGVSRNDRILFSTALGEVAGNVVQHSAAKQSVRFKLELRVYPDRVEAQLTDSGPAVDFDLAGASLPDLFAESGRGLALAMAAAEVTYAREGSVNRWGIVRRRGT